MLRSRRITPNEYDRFIAFNQQNSGAIVNNAYLQGANPRVFYRRKNPDQWLAGYAVNTRSPFRCLCVFDSDQQQSHLNQHHLQEENLAEITLLCRNRSYRWQSFEREQYYLLSLWDAFRTGRAVILGATTLPSLVNDLKNVLDQVLYDGDVTLFGNNRHGWVLFTSRWRIPGNTLRYIGKLMVRALLKKQTGKSLPTVPQH